jgi:hypothetical protein
LSESAVDSIKSIALKCLDISTLGSRPASRIAAFIARIGIVAQKSGEQQVLTASIKALKEVDQKDLAKQIELQPGAESYDAFVLNAISELTEDLKRRNPLIDPEDATFFQRVKPEDIRDFLELLSQHPGQGK